VKVCEDFAPNFGDKKLIVASQQHTVLHFLFSQGIFGQNSMTVISHPPDFLFPRLKIKLKGHNFDTTEVFEAESQTVLNTLTEHDFQDSFKKLQKSWKLCICAEWD
jgi:hypothetical protein